MPSLLPAALALTGLVAVAAASGDARAEPIVEHLERDECDSFRPSSRQPGSGCQGSGGDASGDDQYTLYQGRIAYTDGDEASRRFVDRCLAALAVRSHDQARFLTSTVLMSALDALVNWDYVSRQAALPGGPEPRPAAGGRFAVHFWGDRVAITFDF
jgi:hypothetical protein